MIDIDRLGGLIVTVIEYDDDVTIVTGDKKSPKIRVTAVFRVNREIAGKASPLEGDHVQSMEIWFRAIHDVAHVGYTVPLDEMWHIVAAGDKYDLDIRVLEKWFAHWYNLQKIARLDTRELLYPCFAFNHARGFMDASKKLVYESTGHITEKNPTKLYELHLEARIMQQLNAAKGRLKIVLHRDLFRPIEPMLSSGNCKPVKDNVFGYFKELFRTQAWPIEDYARTKTMQEILDELENFHFLPSDSCNTVRTRTMREIQENLKNFQFSSSDSVDVVLEKTMQDIRKNLEKFQSSPSDSSDAVHIKTMQEILEKLGKIQFLPLDSNDDAPTHRKQEFLENFIRYLPSDSYHECQLDYETIVKDAREHTQEYFDGICLDCLDKTKSPMGDSDKDYWTHQDFKEDSKFTRCRVHHMQPTWYFSFMGRNADRDIFLKRHRSHGGNRYIL